MFYTDLMAARIGVRELNQQTSQVLDRVRAGEVVEITDRGVPVAEIRPVGRERSALARMESEGQLNPPTIDAGVLQTLSLRPVDDVNVADLLAADREEERW
jgi:prevent-host-death family protein